MTLEKYKEKRNFKKTSEPKGKIKSSKDKKLIFVIHKHHARNLHWDLRLEMNGVLASWAVPKEPPTEKGVKRLAVQVEDHPLQYATFKGVIPEGNYGAGKVEIWDNGTYEVKHKDEKKFEIIMHGKKLNGHFVLVKTFYGAKPEKSWLWFKV